MSRFHGPQQPGATRDLHEQRRRQAEMRDDTSHAERHTPRPDTAERDCE